jgi:diguanylate cyclase
VALLDVDHFKRVNDRFSHGVGDEVLRRLAALLSAQCRSNDFAARYGGEEFALVLHDVGVTRAETICERVRAAVEAFAWNQIAAGLAVTISIGLADVAAASSVADGLSEADRRLYQAKACGRNRVVGPTSNGATTPSPAS